MRSHLNVPLQDDTPTAHTGKRDHSVQAAPGTTVRPMRPLSDTKKRFSDTTLVSLQIGRSPTHGNMSKLPGPRPVSLKIALGLLPQLGFQVRRAENCGTPRQAGQIRQRGTRRAFHIQTPWFWLGPMPRPATDSERCAALKQWPPNARREVPMPQPIRRRG